MALTSNCDLYAAVHDQGINRVVNHIMRQRPSLFNYGTILVKSNPSLLCSRIDAAPGVTELITLLPRVPLLPADATNIKELTDLGIDLSAATNLGLDFAAQLTELQVDFHPGDAFTLPSELNPPLKPQRMAFHDKLCAGLSCIPKDIRRRFPPVVVDLGNPGMNRRSGRKLNQRTKAYQNNDRYLSDTSTSSLSTVNALTTLDFASREINRTPSPNFPKFPPFPIFPIDKLECFCIELFGIGSSKFQGQAGNQKMLINMDGIELKDLAPVGLENSIECYMEILLERVLLPQISDVVSELAFSLHEIPPPPDAAIGSIQISAATTVPNNPAIEDNQLKLFINLDQLTLSIPPITVGDGGTSNPPPTRITRNRTRTGPAHITAAISEKVFQRIFGVIRDTGKFKIHVAPQTASIFGVTGSASADIEFHLANGAVSFQSDGTIKIDELDIKWDKLDVTLGLNLPSICFEVPVPVPWPPFVEWVSLGCLFEGNPDLSFTIHLPTGFTTEISTNAGIKTYYGLGTPNEWLVYITPSRVQVDIIDIADTVGDILDAALNAAINVLGLPSWASTVVDSIVDLVRGLLDIPDDVGEWLQNLIFDTLGIETTIESYIAIWLADSMPIFRLEDPKEVMEAKGSLIPVKIPIEYLGATIDDNEMTLILDVGA